MIRTIIPALIIFLPLLTGCEEATPRELFGPPGSYCLSPDGDYVPVVDDATC